MFSPEKNFPELSVSFDEECRFTLAVKLIPPHPDDGEALVEWPVEWDSETVDQMEATLAITILRSFVYEEMGLEHSLDWLRENNRYNERFELGTITLDTDGTVLSSDLEFPDPTGDR